MRLLLIPALSLMVSGCIVTEPGWHGSHAHPFDAARAQCEHRTSGIRNGHEREQAFDRCMGEQGWTHAGRDDERSHDRQH